MKRKKAMSSLPQDDEQLRAEVRTRYAKTALQVLGAETLQDTMVDQQTDACCASGCCTPGVQGKSPITSDIYTEMELGTIPVAAALASLGCGNPTALAELRPGEKVLDLGSGGGVDVLLAAKRVGPTGFAYGLDMTDPMLDLAERNRQEAGVENAQFLKGIIEDIPLSDSSVDVVISNCVVNLSADKGQVLREAYRVLTPGGRFAVSDIIFQGQIPAVLRVDLESWAGCMAGALEEETYGQLLSVAGFVDIEIEVTRRYSLDDIGESGARASIAALSVDERSQIDGKFVSAFVRARKPQDK
jgi:SAM-dependent methyltransferase